MFKWIISLLLVVSPLSEAAEPGQYSNVTILPNTNDRSGVGINLNNNTLLICEGACYLLRITNSRVDKNAIYFTVNGYPYSVTFSFNKIILNSLSPVSDPYFDMQLLFACNNKKPVDVKCWPHEKFKMRN